MGHEQHERLSAYLDGELSRAERARVAAHLEACAECGERLAELAAADRAVAALPAEAPADYFESFPQRVRARLSPRPAVRRLPAWTWAAAAALLLAVVTPLTLREADAPATAPAPARLAPAATPPALTPATSQPAASLEGARQAGYDEQKPQAEPERRLRANAPAELQKRETAFAREPEERDARTDAPAAGALAPQAAPPAAPAPAAAREEEAAAAAVPAQAESFASGVRSQDAAADSKRAAPRDAMADAVSGEAMGGRARAARPAEGGTTVAAKLLASEAEWQRLEARRPRTPEEWRRLREDWRLFVARDPGGPLADPARLRMIEAGRATWRASSLAEDETAFREDAAAYLEREAAPQKDRVRRLLSDPGAR